MSDGEYVFLWFMTGTIVGLFLGAATYGWFQLLAYFARPQDPPQPPTVWTPVDHDTRADLNAIETGLFEEQR
jgi:hypothetical protein